VIVAGAFVVVEGPEGAGKSSLVRALGARLLADGMQVLPVRQPGGTPVAEAARKVALRSRHEISPAAELFLFLAARADLVARVIRPAIEAGQIVLADRFDLSTRAYQVAGRGLPAADVDAALRLATGGLVPDLTLVLDIPVEIGRSASAGHGRCRIDSSARMTPFTSACSTRIEGRQGRVWSTSTRHRRSQPCWKQPGERCRR
jgi:dTMP kinase